ncbi:MAG: aphA [Gemmataceae bacterium]|nr:aphA [Gemmataceae bacterium]
MRVIVNRHQAAHAPPQETDNGLPVPPWEVPDRVAAIRAALEVRGGFVFEDAPPGDADAVTGLHDPAYVTYLRETGAELAKARGAAPRFVVPSVFPFGPAPRVRGGRAARGGYCFDTFTPITAGTYAAALGGAAAALRAADLVAGGGDRAVYVLTRPPGHHAEKARCGGYSYLNNAALAADRLSKLGPVAVLDLDVHHGNGTQHLFYHRADVLTVSVHGDPELLFPYFSGFEDETGTGPGLGFNRNLPLPPGTGERKYRPALETALEVVSGFRPAFVVVSFGVDSHEADPIGGFRLPTEYFAKMGAGVRQSGVPVVVVQEGGYNCDVLGACAAKFLGGLEGTTGTSA